MSAGTESSSTTLELHIDELLFDLPGLPGLDEAEARRMLQEALVKLAERLERTPPSWDGDGAREVRIDSLQLEALPSAEALAEALHAQLLRGMR